LPISSAEIASTIISEPFFHVQRINDAFTNTSDDHFFNDQFIAGILIINNLILTVCRSAGRNQ